MLECVSGKWMHIQPTQSNDNACLLFLLLGTQPKRSKSSIMALSSLPKALALVLVWTLVVSSFVTPFATRGTIHEQPGCHHLEATKGRRDFLSVSTISLVSVLSMPGVASAGIDPSALKSLPVEGDVSGQAQRLRQLEAIKNPETDLVDVPFEELPDGVSYREYRRGKGEATVKEGSKVAVEMTIRCKSFATANEPGGLKYFSTKEDTEFNEVAFTVGSGEILPGLEEGMMGMRKGALRRIEVPTTMVYAAKRAGQLPLPTTKDGKRRFENLFKTDAALLFEVLVTRVK